MPPTIVITMGDPAGIGPEVVVKALAHADLAGAARYVVLGDRRALPAGLALPPAASLVHFANVSPQAIAARAPTPEGGRASIEYVERGIRMTLTGEAQALVTAPISKTALALAGIPYPGHTDLLAERTQAPRHAMMFVSPRLRVTLVSIHQSLRDALDALTPGKVIDAIELTHRALVEWLGVAGPRVALAGVNPHAGEGGLFGREEAEVLAPALAAVRAGGLACEGPLPPDTVFRRAVEGEFDAVVSMYHDQGLIPVKLLAFHQAVNLTLGLPIVRTSPDHGTAYDIAGTGRADPGSMKAAIQLAIDIARRRSRSSATEAQRTQRETTTG